MTLLAVGCRRDRLMVEGGRFTGVAGLAVVVLTRQATGVAIRTGQPGAFDANDIMVLGLGGTRTAGRRPEGIVMTGGAGLRHQGVMAPLAVGDSCSQHEVMVLPHRCVAAGRRPEGRVVAEFAAVGGRDVRSRTVAEATGNVRWDTRVVLVVVLAQAHITRGMATITAAIKGQRSVTAVAVNCRVYFENRMMRIARGQRVAIGIDTPVAGIVTGRTPRDFTRVTVATATGHARPSYRHIVMLLLVRRTRRVTILASSNRLLQIKRYRIVAIRAGQCTAEQGMVTVSSFALVTVMTVEGARGVGMTSCTITLRGGRIVVDFPGSLSVPVIGRVVATLAVGDRLHLSMTFLAADAIGFGGSMVSRLDIAAMAADTAGQRFHGGMTGGTIDRVAEVCCCAMVRGADAALVTV